MSNLKLAIWYNTSPDTGELSTRQRIIRAEQEYHTITAENDQDVNIRLNCGMIDCVAVAIMIQEPSEATYKNLDNIGDVTLHVNEANITRNFHEMSQAREQKVWPN